MANQQDNNRLYVLISNRLQSVYGAIQGGHAIAQWMLDHLNDLRWKNETVVFLSCDIEKMLFLLEGEDFSTFREPDLDNQLTAIAVLANSKNRKLFKHLKLLQ